MAAEAEGVVGDGVDLHFAGLVGDVVEVAVGVGGLVVDGRRHGVGLERLAADGHLHRAGGPEHVAGGAFCGADGEAAGVVAKDGLDGLCLADVALRRGGAVGVDVGNILGVESAGGQCRPHGACAAFAAGCGGGHVVGVGGVTVAGDLAVNPRVACLGVLEGLEHDDAGAFAHDEAVAPGVEWPGGVLGIVVAPAHGPHAVEAAHGDGVDGGLGAAGEHDVGVAHDEGAPCLADGVACCGAGGAGGDVGAAQSVVEREHPGCHVEDHHRDEEWGNPAGAAVEQCLVLFLHRAKPADTGADEGADAVAVGLVQIQPGVVDRLPAGDHGELGEPVGAPYLLGRGEGRGGVEVLDFAGDGAGVALGVVCRDWADAALAGEEIFPEGTDPLAKRGDDAESCDDDALSCWVRHETRQGSQAKRPGLPEMSFSL